MTIRPLLSSDLQVIREIDAICFPADDQYDSDTYESMLISGRSIVVIEDGDVVGYAFVQDRIWDADLHIRSLAVHPNYRRHGYGEAMLRSVIDSCNCPVDLLVDELNANAVRLYTRLGFVRSEMPSKIPAKIRMVRP